MPTYPLTTLAPTIDDAGISAPSFEDILLSLQASFQQTYGASVYLEPDSQDGQWIAVLARVIHESNQAAILCFRSFSPTYAQGTNLSSLVKINGLLRLIASKSTAIGNVVGVAGTTILNGKVTDTSNNVWLLPSSVTIPVSGEIAVTIIAEEAGAITTAAGLINSIVNPQRGWQSFVSTTDAVPGAPVESDATLRQRQTASTTLPAQAIKDSILGAVSNVTGVSRVTIYENDTPVTDANGIPAHSFSVVALGGDILEIATAIARRKPPGIQTFGTSTATVYDETYGLPTVINYFPLDLVEVYYSLTIKALTGYKAATGQAIIDALVAFTANLEIGEDVYYSQVMAAASLQAISEGGTFYITALTLGIAPAPVGTANLPIAFDEAATSLAGNIVLTVT